MVLSKHGVWVLQDLYSYLSLQTHLSCFLSPALHLTVSHIKLLAMPETWHAHSQCGMPFFSLSLLCSFLPGKDLLIFQGSAQPSHSLQGYIYWAPTLTPEELTIFFFWAPSPHNPVDISLTLLDCKLLKDSLSVRCIPIPQCPAH